MAADLNVTERVIRLEGGGPERLAFENCSPTLTEALSGACHKRVVRLSWENLVAKPILETGSLSEDLVQRLDR
ncbi:hypothetical protein WN48_06460 [Eufriesea mexicana]|uniref:Uncharacterized protein n=1 Tax=Eufriesea mexicana TaxID=516756 RepID=A0A310SJG7_9HYME|nr:hypothetical protein WN48_06460 [Eufriesea mexicana]